MPYDPRITPEVRAKAREALGRLFSEPPLTGGVFSTGDMFERARAHQDAIIDAILAEVVGPERVIVPREPPEELLISMALRQDHALGIPGYYDQPFLRELTPDGPSHHDRVRGAISTMRQVYEEVVGDGFYRPEFATRYRAMISASQEGNDGDSLARSLKETGR